jgi:hypothetical protein
MYLLGLRALGHEVFYIEDTGECVYDPVQNKIATDPAYGTTYIHDALSRFGLGERWSFVNYDGSYHGAPAAAVREYAASADLFINLSGGSWFWRDEYARIPHKVFIDSDPAFTQLAIAKGVPWYVEFFQRFDRLFTFGANIGTQASDIPVGAFTWHKTWQPITLDDWRTAPAPGSPSTSLRAGRFTTVMSWQFESFTDVGGNKDIEFVKFIDLPSQTKQPFELAINGPQKRCATRLGDGGRAKARTPWEYREFITSKAEFGVAKHTYVANHTGWFSDRRSASGVGRPALVQDTGWTAHLPSGDGLLAFSNPDEAVAGIDRINADYDRHARSAAEIAREHFDASRLLPRLLEISCS